MSDLISRKEVEKVIKDYFKLIIDNTDDDVDCVLDYNKQISRNINELPTTYDVDKVVEQLEKKVFTADLYDFGWNGETVDNLLCLGDVCEIVKGAVKDE